MLSRFRFRARQRPHRCSHREIGENRNLGKSRYLTLAKEARAGSAPPFHDAGHPNNALFFERW
jgi:hypothetical protein